jgi:hypothetical protein
MTLSPTIASRHGSTAGSKQSAVYHQWCGSRGGLLGGWARVIRGASSYRPGLANGDETRLPQLRARGVKARVEGADGAHGPSPVSSDSPAPLTPAASTHAVDSPRAAGKVAMVDKPEPDRPSRSRANRVGGHVGGSPL